jgi:serine/threonine protein kinase
MGLWKVDSDDYIRSAIFREIEILKHLKCPNIVGFYDVMESSRFYYIVQELCDTDLEKFMKKKERL